MRNILCLFFSLLFFSSCLKKEDYPKKEPPKGRLNISVLDSIGNTTEGALVSVYTSYADALINSNKLSGTKASNSTGMVQYLEGEFTFPSTYLYVVVRKSTKSNLDFDDSTKVKTASIISPEKVYNYTYHLP